MTSSLWYDPTMSSRRPGFGDVETQLRPARPGYEATALRRRLEIRWTDADGAHAATIDGKKTVGSAPAADIVVADPAVSRIHAEFEVRDDGVWLRDLGSRNGTFIE